MTSALPDQASIADSQEDWDVVFDHAEDTEERRRLSEHDRWVIDRLVHGAPNRP